VEAAALTIDFVPFTRAYEPGHARLKTRWWLYVAGVYAAAWWPARIELATIDQPNAFVASLAAVVAAIVLCDIAGRRRAGRWAVRTHDQSADPFATITVLDLRSAAPNA